MNLFRKKKKCPITADDRKWLEDAFSWLIKEFGIEVIQSKNIITPSTNFFGFAPYLKEELAHNLLSKVAQQMEVDIRKIQLQFYKEKETLAFSEGVITEYDESVQLTAGKYVQHEDGSIVILVEEKQLEQPISLVATLAHELAHVKLLSDNRIAENDEYLTDLTALFYGFGIFSANASIVKMNTWSGLTHTGWQIEGGSGYLHYKVQAYALAMYAQIRGETSPHWGDYLDTDIQREFRKSMSYLQQPKK